MFRIRRFGVVRTANLAGVLYLVLSLIFVLPFVLILAAARQGSMTVTDQFGQTTSIGFSPFLLLLLPLLYAVIGWIVTALMCLAYNLAARFTGGIEVQLVGDPQGSVRTDVPASS